MAVRHYYRPTPPSEPREDVLTIDLCTRIGAVGARLETRFHVVSAWLEPSLDVFPLGREVETICLRLQSRLRRTWGAALR